eukprot:gene8246-biopygen1814
MVIVFWGRHHYGVIVAGSIGRAWRTRSGELGGLGGLLAALAPLSPAMQRRLVRLVLSLFTVTVLRAAADSPADLRLPERMTAYPLPPWPSLANQCKKGRAILARAAAACERALSAKAACETYAGVPLLFDRCMTHTCSTKNDMLMHVPGHTVDKATGLPHDFQMGKGTEKIQALIGALGAARTLPGSCL